MFPLSSPRLLLLLLIVLLVGGARPALSQETHAGNPTAIIARAVEEARVSGHWEEDPIERLEVPGIGTVWRFNEMLHAGPPIRTEEQADALQRLGINTVMGLDPAPPDWFLLATRNVGAVHTPLTPGLLRTGEWIRMIRPMTWLEGPYYLQADEEIAPAITAAAIANNMWTRRDSSHALYAMTTAGVPAEDVHLWFSATRRDFYRTPDSYDMVPESFPVARDPEPLRWWMQELKARIDFLREARAVGWQTPPAAWGSTTAAEAEVLWRTVGAVRRSVPLEGEDGAMFLALEEYAAQLARSLRSGTATGDSREAAWRALLDHCAACHRAKRDLPGLSVPDSLALE